MISEEVGAVSFEDSITLPCGLSDTTFRNCFLFPGIAVHKNTYVENSVVLKGSILMGCGRITCQKDATYGNGVTINMGNETGGLQVQSFGDLKYNELSSVVDSGVFQNDALPDYMSMRARSLRHSAAIRGDYSVFSPSCFVEGCTLLHSVFVGECCHVLNSTVCSCTLLSSPAHKSEVLNGDLAESILQWGCVFESGSNCAKSILCEHADTSCNAKIVNSIIAPNTGVSSGECNSSLVGPFIGFHHNSVLISALWFEGKGNIGYGANIGSNHTGRLPDQECLPGEGVFFGLGCNIKYPFNLRSAPYTIVASGTTLLPQRVDMPFSLINLPTRVHAGEIFPGWVIYANYYMVLRNEDKFAHRNKSHRQCFATRILRDSVVAMLMRARDHLAFFHPSKTLFDLSTLEVATTPSATTVYLKEGEWSVDREDSAVYLERDIEGLGKNLLTEHNRKLGVRAYSMMIRLYLLRRVFSAIQTTFESMTDDAMSYASLFALPQWNGMKTLLRQEYGSLLLSQALAAYGSIEYELLRIAENSKKKDFTRGNYVDNSYNTTHNYEKDMSVVYKQRESLAHSHSHRSAVDEKMEVLTNLTNRIITVCGDCELCS
ncbi:hypothetical protein BLSTO_04386 [Blastocystis sp. subtype 1]